MIINSTDVMSYPMITLSMTRYIHILVSYDIPRMTRYIPLLLSYIQSIINLFKIIPPGKNSIEGKIVTKAPQGKYLMALHVSFGQGYAVLFWSVSHILVIASRCTDCLKLSGCPMVFHYSIK